MRPLLLSLAFAACLSAGTVQELATGSQMAGGFVGVTMFGGPSASGGITAAGTATGAFFDFSVTPASGDSNVATFSLKNTDSGALARNLVAFSIDLFLSKSLHDSGSLPATPGSGTGKSPVSLTGPAFGSFSFVNPWLDPANTGNMFTGLNVTLATALKPGETLTFSIDTDLIVPEPAQALPMLVLLGLGLAGLKRRQNRTL